MCGITGFVRDRASPIASDDIAGMVASMYHRGPDAGDIWQDMSAGIALGHRRLAVVELSAAGAQPMHSASGRLVIVFNGEIYNHLALRQELPGVCWRGHSDTETLLACLEQWDVRSVLEKLVGMFAFALWDRQHQTLVLARDRFGEKPLYYGRQGGVLLFGSELKALAAYPGWRGQIDREALSLFVRRGYVPAPRTIWKGVFKLPPGSWLSVGTGFTEDPLGKPQPYWRAAEKLGRLPRTDWDDATAADQLESWLAEALAQQMVADVPLGAFLSGGIDSSTIVALMQSRSSRPVRTFTVGFAESPYNEADHARSVASHLGTDHTELRVSPREAMEVIPLLPQVYDEPFGDSSQIPTRLICGLARRHVTVCLSGDGGDELFGGYNRYFWGRALWQRIEPVPRWVRAVGGRAIRFVRPSLWDALGEAIPRRYRPPAFGDRLHKLADVLDVTGPHDLYRRLVSQYRESGPLVVEGAEPEGWADAEVACFGTSPRAGDYTEAMMFNDLVDYLGEDILTKVDRAAMSASLETRVPFLDHRVAEFAWSLPIHMKIRNGQGKWLLRQVLYRHVPPALIERPKQGFSVPIDSWLRGPLRDWAEDLLDAGRLRQEGYLHVGPIRQKWLEHLSGRRNWQHVIWNVLMFQAWHAHWKRVL